MIDTSDFMGQARTKFSNGDKETECLVTGEDPNDLATGYLSDLVCNRPSLGPSAPVIPTFCHSLYGSSTLPPQDLCPCCSLSARSSTSLARSFPTVLQVFTPRSLSFDPVLSSLVALMLPHITYLCLFVYCLFRPKDFVCFVHQYILLPGAQKIFNRYYRIF